MDCCGLKDKAIIVTGAAVGTGRVTAVRFALGVSNGPLNGASRPSANVLPGKAKTSADVVGQAPRFVK
jgi:NAD(P)-dependent dehydrogenase (short-subunit alcohol dehydrogenase family)